MKLPQLSKPMMIAIVCIAIFLVWYLQKPSVSGLIYYYSPNCPHCVKFMPEWETIGLPKRKVNCDTESCPGIEALPTIMYNGKEYGGERTKAGIESFVNKM